MLTVRFRKSVEFVFVTGTLLLMLFAEPVLAKKAQERVTTSKQLEQKIQTSSNVGQASSKVSTSSQKATQETKLRTSWRNNSGRTHKTGIHQVRNDKQRRVAKWKKQRQPHEEHLRKKDAPAQLRSSSRLRKRLSFDTRRRMSLDTKRRVSLDTKRRITVFDMNHKAEEPTPENPWHRKPGSKKNRPIAMQQQKITD